MHNNKMIGFIDLDWFSDGGCLFYAQSNLRTSFRIWNYIHLPFSLNVEFFSCNKDDPEIYYFNSMNEFSDPAEKANEKKRIYVTRPSLPPLEEFAGSLGPVWDSRILTNNGPLNQKLEQELARYLGVENVSLFANGTLALLTALEALEITGEVITTPFTFAAMTHTLLWKGIRPVFADIEPGTCNIDPVKVEESITPETKAILPVHLYGYPCRVDDLERIADNHGLKLLYDACHNFGERLNGIPVQRFGDLTVMSFHATKVFTTCEGGAVISHDAATKERIDLLRNFGFAGETKVTATGINGKMNEMQAALGLLQLKYVDRYIERRKTVSDTYRENLSGIPGLRLMDDRSVERYSYPFFPVFIDERVYGRSRDEIYNRLKEQGIYARRYFYPLVSSFPMYRHLFSASPDKLPVAEEASKQVLCLPIYPDLPLETIANIASLIRQA